MGKSTRLITIGVVALIVVGLVLAASGNGIVSLVVDYWFHEEVGYTGFFWLKLMYRYILSGLVTLFFFLVFFLNFWAASRYLGVDEVRLEAMEDVAEQRQRQALKLLQTGSMRVYIPLSLVMAIVIATPFYHHWEEALLFVFGPSANISDPLFKNDVSFYLFSYPIFELIQVELFVASAIVTLAIALLYYREHKVLAASQKVWPAGAKIHMAVTVAITAAVSVWGFMLHRFNLLYTDVHEPVFFGPGFLEIRYTLPLIWVSIVSLAGLAGAAIYYGFKRRGLAAVGGFAGLFLVALILREIDAIPAAVNRFVVKPNPVKTERDFMQNNIDATLAAYDLRDVQTIQVSPGLPDEDVLDPELRSHLYNIPVWDPEFLDDVYQQLQGIRPYYRFTDVDVARYLINGRLEQVNLAAREVDIDALPEAAKNWENAHLRYTHGFGAVVTPAAQEGATPIEWYLHDLNMQTDAGFTIEKPDIYFGEAKLPYAIAPNKLNVVGMPSVDEDSSFNYSGKGGVPLSSLLRKLFLALYLQDEKLFFSFNIGESSRALFHRNIISRIKTLTPFLELDRDAYSVITPKRVYWIIDAYTLSDSYPAAVRTRQSFNGSNEQRPFNYIRNSVKVVVDAFDGTVDYYIADPKDPIIQGYRKAFPGLFKELSALPPMLRDQLRYPKDLFTAQMKVFSRYHQTAPELFYEQAETWEFPNIDHVDMKPFYFTTKLEGYLPDQQSFVLILPMTPVGRSNLSVLAVAGTPTVGANMVEGQAYRRQLVLYKFSREVQVEGPAQVNALIDQDPEIARQLTLWDQRGSRVLRGRIIVLPVGRSVLYVQPVYIASSGATRIPELQRIILSMGNVVVMESTLEQGIQKLEQRLKELRARTRSTPATTPPPAAPTGPSIGPM